jgi:predicted RNA polymerase sigma factor
VALVVVDRLSPSTGSGRDPSTGSGRSLSGYHAYHATRADLLRRLGRSADARAAYERAIELAGNTAEVAYLTRRRDQLGPT